MATPARPMSAWMRRAKIDAAGRARRAHRDGQRHGDGVAGLQQAVAQALGEAGVGGDAAGRQVVDVGLQDDDVDARIPPHDAEGGEEAVGVPGDVGVDGVAQAVARRGQVPGEALAGVVAEGREIQAGARDGVGGQDGVAAAAPDEGDAGAAHAGQPLGRDGEVEQRVGAGHVDQPGLPHDARPDVGGPGQAARVAGDGARARPGRAALEHGEGFAGGQAPGQRHEAAALLDALQVGEDDVGVRVAGEVVDQVRLVEVERVAVGGDVAEAQAARLGPHDDLAGVGAALREHGDAAGRAVGLLQPADAAGGAVDAHAVGPQQADAVGAGAPQQLRFEGGALRQAGLAEAGGDEVEHLDSLPGRLIEQVEHGVGRDDGDDEVDLVVGHVAQAGVEGRPRSQGAAARVERVEALDDAVAAHQLEPAHAVEAALGPHRDARDGDGARPERGGEGVAAGEGGRRGDGRARRWGAWTQPIGGRDDGGVLVRCRIAAW